MLLLPNGNNTLNTDIPTTDEMDKTTEAERRALVGFCEKDQEWYKFTEPNRMHECGNMPSNRVGFQITSQRTFNPAAKKMTKAQLKKMVMGT